jgi:hypothetical protein
MREKMAADSTGKICGHLPEAVSRDTYWKG